ncbi:cytochrome C oxidase subunit IV family protein [Nocardia gamkensis]|uniref:cytochrome C oxidase subunit IV family protein n=1 Tax=Nocardia gamkensis TaxID=352869 RepID=UPI0037C63613
MSTTTVTDHRSTRRVDAVWLMLMAATVITTWVLSKDMVSSRIALVATVVIATAKVRFVLLDFMELRSAPLTARALFEAWPVGVALMVVAMT